MKWDITNRATGHFDVTDVSIKVVRSERATAWPNVPTYWSKNGSKMMTSSPGSMKPINALSIPLVTINVSPVCSGELEYHHPTFVGTSGDRNLGVWVQSPSEERGVCVGDGFLETGATLNNRISGVFSVFPSAIDSLHTFVGEYWLHSTRSKASFAASRANFGGL